MYYKFRRNRFIKSFYSRKKRELSATSIVQFLNILRQQLLEGSREHLKASAFQQAGELVLNKPPK